MSGKTVRVTIPPELFSEAALLSYLGMSAAELKKVWYYRGRMYHNFDIAKKSGKLRLINAPDCRLKYLQRRIACQLNKLYRLRNPVHGYVVKRSVKTNATAHINQRYVLNLDIKDFFGSITERRVEGLLSALGLSSRVAAIIARVCCYNGCLPQGGPASPVLSNMICFRLDRSLMAVAKDAKCIYTRYADDITFSSLRPPSTLLGGVILSSGSVAPEALSSELVAALGSNGFVLNPEKIHYADRYSRRIVTGVKVNEGLNLDRRYVRNIRATLYAAAKDEMAAQARYEAEFGGTSTIAAYLKGKISWLGNIKGVSDPVYRSLAVRFNEVFPSQAINVQPTRQERLTRSVWVIEHEDIMSDAYQQGSAFFLAGLGLVTAAHCVEGIKEAVVHHPSKPSNKFKIVVSHYSKHRDLALLSHAISKTEFYELEKSSKLVATGDPVAAAGYPDYGPSDKINVRHGTVSSTTIKSTIDLMEVNFKLAQGMSGGPVIDANDAVVGIIHKGGPQLPRDFAILVSVLEKWIAIGAPDDY